MGLSKEKAEKKGEEKKKIRKTDNLPYKGSHPSRNLELVGPTEEGRGQDLPKDQDHGHTQEHRDVGRN